jgi:hypothetical protein
MSPAAVALFTDDAVIDTESGYCAKSSLRRQGGHPKGFRALCADKTRRVTPLNTFVSGNVLVTRFEARSATIQKAGVERVILWGIREIARRQDCLVALLLAGSYRLADGPLPRMGLRAPVGPVIQFTRRDATRAS